MKFFKFFFVMAVVGCALLIVAGPQAKAGMSSANYQIPNDVMSGGGTSMSSASYQMNATLGQSSPLGNAMSTNYDNYPGFWQGDECMYDPDEDGLANADEYYYLTDPYNWDTDSDQVGDGDEVALNMDPFGWDSDDDGMPDKFEFDNMSGHTENLDPVFDDGNDDFDSDLNPNVHEYWNGTDLWVADPMNHHGFSQFGCAYWGEGNGNCVIDSGDLTNLKNNLMANPSDYSGVIPDNSDTQELNGNGVFDSGDLSYLKGFLILSLNTNVPSRADELVVLSQPSGPVQVGDTCHVTLGVRSVDTSDSQYTAGFAVVFQTSGNGSATVWGGDGDDSGNRYDYSGAVSESAPARVTLRIDSAGTIEINPYIPQCQGGPGPYEGRYSPQINLSSPITIVAED